ncbi:hypothetical protein NQ314_011479 [Rhamnusium bicolor]|uniref:Uncharacterized protein n=1 Tax=Rhamnusium bicolor TaxID=1586634 RepID=A0AAV8XIK4_9CUCU|nr:hypothetical protein NQ314_011479 [Rhamnusium bicolor]
MLLAIDLKNEILNTFNIRNKRSTTSNPSVSQMRLQVRSCVQKISTINETLRKIDLNESVLEFSVFSVVIPHY